MAVGGERGFMRGFFFKIFMFYAHGNNPVMKKSLMNPPRGIIDGAWSLRRQETMDRSEELALHKNIQSSSVQYAQGMRQGV